MSGAYDWDDDAHAWGYLQSRGFRHTQGIIQSPGRQVTEKEDSAIIYLHCEWDWGYEGDFT